MIAEASTFYGKKVAILTSGGDSQGMNAAIRSCGRMILSMGARAFTVKWGYQGLVDGADNIKECSWTDFSKIIHIGGTNIGSARCKDFTTVEGRLKACLNMIQFGINHLVVIGGDGSLTGADIFRREWPDHMRNLLESKKIAQEQHDELKHLSIVGMVGSIDNDFCGTDMTIGADSALHRICECIDSIITTAESHQRAFIVEIMGRHSGYLALSSGIAVGADYVFLPEFPPNVNWKEELCERIQALRAKGKKYTIILVAEGATDKSGHAITSNGVKDVVSQCSKLDCRVTVLGHIQRGGSPSAYDRILGSRQGIEAAINVLISTPGTPSYVICTQKNAIVRVPLNECITMCNGIKEAFEKRDIDKVVSLRGSSFVRNLNIFEVLHHLHKNGIKSDNKKAYKFAVVHTGAPSAGMDPCTRAFVIWCISKGHSVIGFKNGFEGVVNEDFVSLNWQVVESWFSTGGSSLGASRFEVQSQVEKIATVLKNLKIDGLVVIGGFDTVFYLKCLHQARNSYEGLKIPIIMVPATISNNIACTSHCLGADTTLNVITRSCDALRLSAKSSRKRIFVVETFGKQCGYLPWLSALASAADNAYALQNSPSIYDLIFDIENYKYKFANNYLDFGLLTLSNEFSEHFSIDSVEQIFNDVGKDHFTARKSILGHIQQGSTSSPFDRFLAVKFGTKTASKIIDLVDQSKTNPSILSDSSTCCMIASTGTEYKFIDFQTIIDESHPKFRAPKEAWWMNIREILKILSHNNFSYESVTVPGQCFTRHNSFDSSK